MDATQVIRADLDLGPALHRAFPTLPFRARAVLDGLVLGAGSIGLASRVATRLGLPNRFALTHLMHHAGLPALRELTGWVSVLTWTMAAEQTGASLLQLAVLHHRTPAVCYRLVKRVTGLSWRRVQTLGARWVMHEFLRRCAAVQCSGMRSSGFH